MPIHLQITYAYDDLNRLTEARYSNGLQVRYSYDPAGNRTSVEVTPPSPISPMPAEAPIQQPVASDVSSSGSVICPSCGKSSPIGKNFCRYCGCSLKGVEGNALAPVSEPDQLTCPKCGKVSEPDKNFCGYCGSPLSNTS
jgi:YD repeat-containing protein